MVLLRLPGQGNWDFTHSQSPQQIDRSRTSKLNPGFIFRHIPNEIHPLTFAFPDNYWECHADIQFCHRRLIGQQLACYLYKRRLFQGTWQRAFYLYLQLFAESVSGFFRLLIPRSDPVFSNSISHCAIELTKTCCVTQLKTNQQKPILLKTAEIGRCLIIINGYVSRSFYDKLVNITLRVERKGHGLCFFVNRSQILPPEEREAKRRFSVLIKIK